MCPFHQLSNDDKILLRNQLLEIASAMGGQNSFLKVLESIKKTFPEPLLAKNSHFKFQNGTINWNKTIHKETLLLLNGRLRNRKENNLNLMTNKDAKDYKQINNMLRTFSPITFTITITTAIDPILTFKGVDMIDEETTFINPLFEIFFFCPVNLVKKAIHFIPEKEAVENENEN